MRIYIIFTWLLVFISNSIIGQSKYDNNWTLGYDTSDWDNIGNVILMNFDFVPVSVNTVNTVKSFETGASSSAMSDQAGNLVFYTNGCYVVNAAHEIMQNGDSINPGIIQQYYCPFGYSFIQDGVISIPFPDSPNLYLLFVKDYASIMFPGEPQAFNGGSLHLYFNIIDMTKDGGLGAVVSKNRIAIADSLCPNSIEACRHANGRDWWILTAESHKNCFYLNLVTPAGVQAPQKVCTGVPWNDADQVGQSCFTPDGTKFIRFNDWNGIHIFDFDDSNGILSNQRVIQIDDVETNYAGIAVSPNSRFLYVGMGIYLYQFDLWASDIGSSRILLAIQDPDPDPFVPSGFRVAATGPDGKIYISSGSSHLSLHVIHRPDCLGQYSLLKQRGLKLTSYNYYSIPNMPFFRNEPSNSPCDSVSFSTYISVPNQDLITLFPNPVKEKLNIFSNLNFPEELTLCLFDNLGRIQFVQNLEANKSIYSVQTSNLSSGIYFYVIKSFDKILKQGKILIQH